MVLKFFIYKGGYKNKGVIFRVYYTRIGQLLYGNRGYIYGN